MKTIWNWLSAKDVSNDLGFGCAASVFRWLVIIGVITAIVVLIVKLTT